MFVMLDVKPVTAKLVPVWDAPETTGDPDATPLGVSAEGSPAKNLPALPFRRERNATHAAAEARFMGGTWKVAIHCAPVNSTVWID